MGNPDSNDVFSRVRYRSVEAIESRDERMTRFQNPDHDGAATGNGRHRHMRRILLLNERLLLAHPLPIQARHVPPSFFATFRRAVSENPATRGNAFRRHTARQLPTGSRPR